MKKRSTLAIIAFVCTIAAANAQLSKGTVMWGGNLIGGYVQTDKAGELNVLLSPKIAKFIRNGIAVGGYANLGLARSYQVAIEWIYQAGALARYYVGKNDGNLSGTSRLFIEATAGYAGSTIAEVSSSGINLGVGPGFAYFIRENASIEGIIKYDALLRSDNEDAINEIRFGLGFQLYLFPRK
ncbi:hypothetical protein [Niastella populi]|uniref:Outer membrane protein beta-barrel domain-containing protein n=1 Tax=Niastella populi TaxID=550983 RepID=A0A1V9GCL1_9BACT|nr:hypothetical protein [Niastella populi]OQP68277.1 hypothetical protein A4R26_00245 [Niastella populi]